MENYLGTKEILNRFMKVFYPLCDDKSDGCDNECHKCAKLDNTIIEALEKQIPKKVDLVIKTNGEFIGTACPKCRAGKFGFDTSNYCEVCGQRLDFSEVE